MSQRPAIGAAFDTGRIRCGAFDVRQLHATGHAFHLEEDYRIMREEFGMTVFRDGICVEQLARGDWSHLDRMANIANGQVWLSLFHYDWPPGTNAQNVLSKRPEVEAARLAGEIAERYKGVFPVYFPAVEIGYWAAMIGTHRAWWPATEVLAGDWWTYYRALAKMTIASARMIRATDPDARIAMSEPWGWCDTPTFDLARPFYTLMGIGDGEMHRRFGSWTLHGAETLLQIAGLNCYGRIDAELLRQARRLLPSRTLVIAETGNCHHPHIPAKDWMRDTLEAVQESGVDVEAVFWAPAVTIADFGSGRPAPGALLSRSGKCEWAAYQRDHIESVI